MRLFVTGATGFIGSHFVNAAHNDGHEVIALKRKKGGGKFCFDKKPIWVEGSLDDNLVNHMKGCDVLIHFAAHSPNLPYDTLENCLYWNLTATLRLFNQAEKAGIDKFIVAGTCFEYGKSGERYDFIPTDAPLEPVNTYSISKAAASVTLSGWSIEKKVWLKNLRIFQVFGEGELESRLWPSLRKAALGGQDYPMTNGEQVRDFIHVEQVARQFLTQLEFDSKYKGTPQVLNIGSGNPQSVLEFSKYWWKYWGAKGKLQVGKLPYRKNEVMRYVPKL